jgi:hypothetical protein
MRIKKSIFGSRDEYKVYRALQSRWSKYFALYPSLPFSCIIPFKSIKPFLTPEEREIFLKLNVDYTLCTKNAKPILSIEFDGLGKGFSKNGEYIPAKTHDPYRKLKMDLKLRIANMFNYPFFIISEKETKPFKKLRLTSELKPKIVEIKYASYNCRIIDLELTIVDGIIGQILAKKTFRKKLHIYKDMLKSSDDVIDLEVITENEADPIAKLATVYMSEAFQKNIIKEMREDFLYPSEISPLLHYEEIKSEIERLEKYREAIKNARDPEEAKRYTHEIKNITERVKTLQKEWEESLEKRINTLQNVKEVGWRVILKTTHPKIQTITQPIWVRNFRSEWIDPPSIARNIAQMLAFKKALELYS